MRIGSQAYPTWSLLGAARGGASSRTEQVHEGRADQ